MGGTKMTIITETEAERLYNDALDDIYGTITIGSLSYQPSRTLKEIDPIAYRCGLADYIDSLDMEIK